MNAHARPSKKMNAATMSEQGTGFNKSEVCTGCRSIARNNILADLGFSMNDAKKNAIVIKPIPLLSTMVNMTPKLVCLKKV
jgi:hypothetical protein